MYTLWKIGVGACSLVIAFMSSVRVVLVVSGVAVVSGGCSCVRGLQLCQGGCICVRGLQLCPGVAVV